MDSLALRGDRAAPTLLSVAPELVAPPAEGGGSSGNFRIQLNGMGTHLSGRLSGGETTHEGPRDVAIGPAGTKADSRNESGRGWTL